MIQHVENKIVNVHINQVVDVKIQENYVKIKNWNNNVLLIKKELKNVIGMVQVVMIIHVNT